MAKIKQNWKISFFFAWHNLLGKPGRTVIYLGVFLVTAVVSFLMIGEILVYRDDRITEEYNSSGYLQQNDKRLSVRKYDNSSLNREDQEILQSLKYVEQVDLYDYANDIRYYIREGTDYKKIYGDKREDKDNTTGEESDDAVEGISLLDDSHFMKSSTCLKQKDLIAGHLPKNRLEVVLYDRSQSLLGKELTCYFDSDNLWHSKDGCHQTVTVVGLLREPTGQVYFHPLLCRMLTAGVDGYSYTMKYCADSWQDGYYHYTMTFYPIIADDLKRNQVRVSRKYILPETDPKTGSLEQLTVESAFCGQSLPVYVTKTVEENTMEEEKGHFLNEENEDGEIMRDTEEEEEETPAFDKVMVEMELSDQGGSFLEVSQELFDRLYGEETTQASVYITSYGRTDQVLKEIQAAGYDGISTWRVSSTVYLENKVYQRLEVLGICSGILIVLAVLAIFLLGFLLKLKQKESELLRFMGLPLEAVKRVDYQELGLPCLVLSLGTMLGFYGIGRQISFFNNILQYETVAGIILYFLYNGSIMLLAVLLFHRKERTLWSNWKN